MRIEYHNYLLVMTRDRDGYELYFRLYYTDPQTNIQTEVWNGLIMGLWRDDSIRETADLVRCWDLYNEGDYFQQTITRLEKGILPNTSFTSIFHEIIRNHREQFDFLNNLYSSSDLDWLNLGYKLYPMGSRFWERQLENEFAVRIEETQRYRAII